MNWPEVIAAIIYVIIGAFAVTMIVLVVMIIRVSLQIKRTVDDTKVAATTIQQRLQNASQPIAVVKLVRGQTRRVMRQRKDKS